MRTNTSPTSSESKNALLIAAGVTMTMGLNTSLIGPSLGALAGRSGVSLAEMGALYSALSIGFLVATPVIVVVSRRFGLRPLLAAPVLLLLSLGLFAAAPSLPALLAAAVVLGIGQSCTQLGYSTWIGLRSRDAGEAASTLNRVLAFYGVGSLLGPLVVSMCYRIWNDPLPGFAIALVPNLAAGLLGLTLPAAQAAAPGERAHGGVWPLLRSPLVLGLAALLAVYVGVEVAFSSWVTEVVVRAVGANVEQAALAASAFFAGFAIGRYFAGVLLARTGVTRGLYVLLAVAAAGVVVMLAPGLSLPVAVAAAAVVGLAYGPIYPTVASMAIRRFPADAASVSSIVGGIASLGMFLIPPATGWVLTGTGGPPGAWGVQLLGMIAMVAIVAWLARR
jgi:fucose permease